MYTNGYSPCFVPIITLAQNAAEVLKEIDIGASSGNHGEYLCVQRCQLKKVQFTLTSEAASGTTTAPTVVITKRPTPLSASGATAVATLTIPSGTAIGATIYKDIDVNMSVGDSMHIAWTVGVGTPTGIGVFSFQYDDDPENEDANNSEVSASA